MQQGFFLMISYFHRFPPVTSHAHGGNLMTVYLSIVKAMAEQ